MTANKFFDRQSPDRSYTVGQVAKLAGVTIRTLHHYEQIGLLEPSQRTNVGYRQYLSSDLDRLSQILFYRELGFPLEEISTLLDDPGADQTEHLRRQHELLTARLKRLQAMVDAVKKEMKANMSGINLTPEEKLEIFGEWLPEEYAEEAEQRWGDTQAWTQSNERTSKFSKDDWVRIKAETDALEARMVTALTAGEAASSSAAMDLAEEHRASIGNYYDCGYEMHRGLGDMYVADERFTKYYEDRAVGLAVWLRDAIHANADRHTV